MMRGPDWVFVSTPKCATRTMYEVLPKFGGERVGGFHARPDPIAQDKTFTFAIVRHPLSRAVSTWWSTCKRGNDRYGFRKAIGSDEFPAFVEWLTEKAPKDFLTMTQYDWHSGHRIDCFLRMEHLQVEFESSLPFVRRPVELPKEGPTDCYYGDWRDHHTSETAERIYQWAQPDFAWGGYSMEGMPC